MNAKTTLERFFDEHFARECLARYATKNVRYFRTTLLSPLRRYLEREPTLSDFSVELHNNLAAWLTSQSLAALVVTRRIALFRRVWREAAKVAVGVDAPVPLPPSNLRTQPPPRRVAVDRFAEARQTPKESVRTLREFYIAFYEPLRLRGKSASTRRQYDVNIGNLERYLGREALIADLTEETLCGYLGHLSAIGKSAGTAAKARNHLRALAGLAFRKRLLDETPEVPAVPQPRRIPRAWMRDELATIWKACRQQQGTIGGVDAAAWWLALHEVLWWSGGERIGAVLQLRWSDVDLESGWLVVPAEFRKFQAADKDAELPPSCVDALRAIQQPKRELIFAFPYDRQLLYQRYRTLLKSAGLPHGRKDKFHRIRRSAASWFEAGGGDATKLLGHSARRVTTASYLDPRIAKQVQAASVLFAPGGPA